MMPGPLALPASLEQPYTVFLDSAPGHPRGEWSLLATDPWQVAVISGASVTLHTASGVREYSGDPWAILAALHAPWRREASGEHPCPGGVFGYWSYELGQPAARVSGQPSPMALPHAVLGWYRRVWAWRAGEAPLLGEHPDAPTEVVRPPLGLASALPIAGGQTLDETAFCAQVERLLAYIGAGDVYQANLTLHMQTPFGGDVLDLYKRLRARAQAPFGAYIALPGATILSASPERFLRLSAAGAVETRPIKGTRPRGATAAEDDALAAELYNSPKERAENLMITDLLRNDIGQVCAIGSVAVPELWAIERLPTVHHLVSTITGQLAPERSAWDLLRACWPGGSITGAPKRRAMEIIAELEPAQRGVYCGSIGYVGFDGRMDTSIVIRTIVVRDGLATWGVGCGIVADSDPKSEYAEAMLKGAALQAAIRET